VWSLEEIIGLAEGKQRLAVQIRPGMTDSISTEPRHQ
jgi:hypothetical protein